MMASEQQTYDAARDGARLIYFEGDAVPLTDKITDDLVILVHGFTSEGGYLKSLAQKLNAEKLKCALFDYASHCGIDEGGRTLAEHISGRLTNNPTLKIALVGHSMGGLVVRYCAAYSSLPVRRSISGIVLLGTPNNGFDHRSILLRVFDFADAITQVNPYLRLPACRASRQLLRKDDERLLTKLNFTERDNAVSIPMLSISGGQHFIEPFAKPHPFFDGIINTGIQKMLTRPNDGLVHEENADITKFAASRQPSKHYNGYIEYSRTNHAGLVRHQILAGYIARFLLELGFAQRSNRSPDKKPNAK
jgi:pimeloyl-ACP methyl ester carboxylesterase